jgi:hypothetical protein
MEWVGRQTDDIIILSPFKIRKIKARHEVMAPVCADLYEEIG